MINVVRLTSIAFVFSFIFVINTSGFQNPNIKISFDSESARAVLDVLGGKAVSDEELTRIAKLPGNQGLINQAARFDKQATEENFKSGLKQIVETGSIKTDPFYLSTVKSRRVAVDAVLNEIERNPQKLIDEITGKISQYSPAAGLSMEVKIYLIAGGTSDGFAPDRKTFYVALHYFDDDYEGLKLLMSHELYHNVQASAVSGRKFIKDGSPKNIVNSFDFLQSTLKEGTASVVGDPLEITNGKKYITWFQGKFRNNLRRIDTNFTLFDTLLYSLYNNPDAAADRIYNIAFSGAYDSALYFVGYRMARIVEKRKGKQEIAFLIGKNPLQFFNEYIELYKSQPDPEAIEFSKSTEDILRKLAADAQ